MLVPERGRKVGGSALHRWFNLAPFTPMLVGYTLRGCCESSSLSF